jgi:hypothetical protein
VGGLGSSGSGSGQLESCCEYGNGPSGSINAGKLSCDFTSVGLSSSAELH